MTENAPRFPYWPFWGSLDVPQICSEPTHGGASRSVQHRDIIVTCSCFICFIVPRFRPASRRFQGDPRLCITSWLPKEQHNRQYTPANDNDSVPSLSLIPANQVSMVWKGFAEASVEEIRGLVWIYIWLDTRYGSFVVSFLPDRCTRIHRWRLSIRIGTVSYILK